MPGEKLLPIDRLPPVDALEVLTQHFLQQCLPIGIGGDRAHGSLLIGVTRSVHVLFVPPTAAVEGGGDMTGRLASGVCSRRQAMSEEQSRSSSCIGNSYARQLANYLVPARSV